MKTSLKRRSLLAALPASLMAAGLGSLTRAARAAQYPDRAVELVVPFQAGGGTDALARAFADASRKHLPQSVVVVNRPGASGAIGWTDVINARPDGYKLAVVTVELVTLPPLGLAKFNYESMQPIARLNADPAAITVKADSPLNTIEDFIAATRKPGADMRVGNAGNGSIWHLAALALGDRTGLQFNHIPFQGAGPAVLALLGGHIDAVAVSPAEVTTYVQAGKLKTLAVMADQRVKNFDRVPTLKERGIDLSIGTWRGIAGPKGLSEEVLSVLRGAVAQTAEEAAFKEVLAKQNLGYSYADDRAFKETMSRDAAAFKSLIEKLNVKVG